MIDAPTGDAVPTRPNVILAVLCFSQLLLAIDVTIVAVANPSIGEALGIDDANLQWTITAYALTFGGFLLLGGRVADMFDRRCQSSPKRIPDKYVLSCQSHSISLPSRSIGFKCNWKTVQCFPPGVILLSVVHPN